MFSRLASRLPLAHSWRCLSTETNVVVSSYKPLTLPAATINLSEFVFERLGEWPDKTAIVCGVSGRGYTYSELRVACRNFARGLTRAKYCPGTTLAILLPNSPDYAVAILGSVEAGLVVTTVNPIYMPAEIAKQLSDCDPRIVVTYPEKCAELEEAIRLAGANSGYTKPLVIVTPSLTSSAIPRGTVSMSAVSQDVDGVGVNSFAINSTTPVVLPYSSGTTGLPKGVVLSHRNLIANSLQLQTEPSVILTEPAVGGHQDCVPAILPFYHIYGLVITLLSKLSVGCKIVTLPRFEVNSFLDAIERHRATVLYLVPPLVLFLGNSSAVKAEHLAGVRFLVSGAAPLGVKDLQRFQERAPGTKCMQAYGMTETSPGLFHTQKTSSKLATVGPCLPDVSAKIVCQETGTALGPGEVGEVCVRGPQNMVGYHNKPEATAQMIESETGWLHTGDLGYYDEDRDFYIVERLKELIKVKGLQVAPAELEEILRSHPDVQDAAVIGIPDERAGERPLAVIVAKSGVEQAVQSFVNSQVSVYKQLAAVKRVETIPKSAAGKILRKVLREDYKAGKL